MRTLRLFVVAGLMSVATVGAAWAQTFGDRTLATAQHSTPVIDSLERAIDRQVARSAFQTVQTSTPQKRRWISRHPALFGALVGFGGGYLIGYLPGDDGVLDDFVAEFNGAVIGAVGALAGAIVGEVVN
jgi:hypothetical protein